MYLARIRLFLKIFSALFLLGSFALGLWLYKLDKEIKGRIEGDWFLPPVEIYSAPRPIIKGQTLDPNILTEDLENKSFRKRPPNQKLFPGDYTIWPKELCQSHLNEELQDDAQMCLLLKTKILPYGPNRTSRTILLVFDTNKKVINLFGGQPFVKIKRAAINPHLFAQFYGGKPILRRIVDVGQVPLMCLQAVTAIEDKNFLKHRGVSPLGILRAAITNVIKGRRAQGGSTITQQLVKNYFLTPERTFKRKFKEMFIAILLEFRLSKDQILQNYLNVIYMGQSGPFQVRGYGAAAEHYFSKPLEHLDLSECSLLAAIVNCPGCFNPFREKTKEKALKRRTNVLSKMLENDMIDSDLAAKAKIAPLPKKPRKTLSEPAPYYVQAIQRELQKLQIDDSDGLRIFTSLNEQAQEAAQTLLVKELKRLEKTHPNLKEFAEKDHKHLEALLVSIDLHTNGILALVGGRGFKKTQYNRVLDAHRQVGSVMKPIVYLTALENYKPDGLPYTPLTAIEDEPFTYKYEGQEWSPQNYDKKYRGMVPMFYSLKNSLNVPTAKLGLEVGLTSIMDVAKRLGITSKIKPLPSLTLGAFELFPWETIQAYSTIANMGLKKNIYYIYSVEDLNGNVVYEHQYKEEQVVAKDTMAVLIGMLKQTVQTGTARSVSTWRGFFHPAAGKTGTTSDTKDAWFLGFTPHVLTAVWVGYDDNTPHGLTGSSGAVPIWANYMKAFATQFPPDDFQWPDHTIQYELPVSELGSLLQYPEKHDLDKPTILIFRTGNEPTFSN